MYDAGKVPEEEMHLALTTGSNSIIPGSFDLGIKMKVMLMQNIGIILGFGVMCVMAMNPDGILQI